MATWDSYTQKAIPEDNDTLMIKDTAGGANKRTPFSGVWNWIVKKLASAVISQLETTNKSIIPAINELNSKSLESVGTISKGDNMLYNSETISNALQEAYGKVRNVSIFFGILYASRVSGSTGTYWTVEGLKSSENNGYIIIRTYGGDITEHRYLLSSGAWNWVS